MSWLLEAVVMGIVGLLPDRIVWVLAGALLGALVLGLVLTNCGAEQASRGFM